MKHLLVILLICSVVAPATAQRPLRTDTTIVFEPSSPIVPRTVTYQPFQDAWGIDLKLSNNGFAAGLFYRHAFTDDLSGTMDFFISDVKDDAEVERYTYYGDSFVPGKKNRLLMFPLMAGLQYRLFKDEIMDNFRPFLTAGGGPAMIFVAPYSRVQEIVFPDGEVFYQEEQVEFFSSLKYGKAHFTVGGYVGAGAYFGIDRNTITGLSFRYYYVPFPSGIEVMEGGLVKRFGGFYINFHFGGYF